MYPCFNDNLTVPSITIKQKLSYSFELQVQSQNILDYYIPKCSLVSTNF